MELESVAAGLAPRLVAYALARTGCRATAEDIAQDALTALVRRWRSAGPPESPDAYVFTIAKRRTGRAIARRALMAPIDAVWNTARPGPSLEQAYADRAELTAVLTALRRLRRVDREAMLLRVVGELSFEAIASITRSRPTAVRMRISRARRRLAALLPEHGHGRRTRTA
jgi:RNA polymerase sigma factor (sigma-70 family)